MIAPQNDLDYQAGDYDLPEMKFMAAYAAESVLFVRYEVQEHQVCDKFFYSFN